MLRICKLNGFKLRIINFAGIVRQRIDNQQFGRNLADYAIHFSKGEAWMNQLGQRIRDLRETSGVSLREVATVAGISIAFLSDFELGKRSCRRHTLGKIAEALGKNGIPATYKELLALHEADRISVLEAELSRLKKRKVS